MNNRIVIPSSMTQEILKCIHEGHMGIEKCKARARQCVYWPSMYEAIEQEVKKSPVCSKYSRRNQKVRLCLIFQYPQRGMGTLETSVGHPLFISVSNCCSWWSLAVAIWSWDFLSGRFSIIACITNSKSSL